MRQDLTHQEAGGLLAQTVQEAVAASRKLIRDEYPAKFLNYRQAATSEIERLKALLDAPKPAEQVQLTATVPPTIQPTMNKSTATAQLTSQPTTIESTATAPSTSQSTAQESTTTGLATGPPLVESSTASAVAESTAAPPATTAPAPQQVVPAKGPAPVLASRAESSSTPPRSLEIERESDSGHDTSSSSGSSSSSPSDQSMGHVTPDVVVRADSFTAATSTSGTVAPPVDDQRPRSPSPQIDEFPSPPSSPQKLAVAQVRQPLPPVQTFLKPPVVSRQLAAKSTVHQVRQPAMAVRTPTRPSPTERQQPTPCPRTGRSPYLKPGRFLPPPTRFRQPPPVMPNPPFQVPKSKFPPLQFLMSETTRSRTPSPPRFRSSSPSTSPVPSDDSPPNFRSSCIVPPQGRQPLTRSCK